MRKPEEFRIFYNRTIHPELRRLDRHRKRMLRRIFFSLLLLLGVAVIVFQMDIFVLSLFFSIPFFIYIAFQVQQIRKFRTNFKPRVVELILDFIDDSLLFGDLKYNANRKIDAGIFLKSGIFETNPASYAGEDHIEGRIGDVEFEMCELDVQEFSPVRARLDLVFRGIFLRATFFYPVRGQLLVVPRKALPRLSPSLKSFIREGGQLMDQSIQNPAFTASFAVFASRNTQVNELLPAELMDFILSYRQTSGEIFLSIKDKNCYVAVSHEKDMLEPKILQSNVSFDLIREFYNEIYLALYVVSALDRSF